VTSTGSPASTARVATDRPGRYGKQLVAHLSHRSEGAWDDDAGTGWIDFGESRAELATGQGSLDIRLAATPERLAAMEDVVDRHLVRFGARDELVVRWIRTDGTPGTAQEDTDPDAVS
jgi:hypothetical protein